MSSPFEARGLLASLLLTAVAAPCLAQYSEDTPWPPPQQSQYPQPYNPYYGYPSQAYGGGSAYQYPQPRTYPYPSQGSYPYAPASPYYRYPQQQPAYQYRQPPVYRYPARQIYQDQASPTGGYAQPAPQTYQAPPVQAAPAPPPYQPAPTPAPPYQAAPIASAPPSSTDGRLLTPDQQGSKDLTSAASAPLHDLNLTRQTIPPVLMAALADPYAAPPAYDCATLASSVDALTEAMGPDYDNPADQHGKGVADARGLGLTLVHGAAASLLPYDGFIKTLSGASAHDHLVMRALAAGGARRAYLKGLGEDRQCGGVASPRHQAVPAAAVKDNNPWRPQYPSWWDRAG